MSPPDRAVVFAFFLFFTVVAVSGMYFDYRKRRLALEALQAAVERGQQLDPVVVERLMLSKSSKGKLNPQHLLIAGILIGAAGFGIIVLAAFLSQLQPWAFYPLGGAGAAAICVGIGLLIALRAIRRDTQAGDEDRSEE